MKNFPTMPTTPSASFLLLLFLLTCPGFARNRHVITVPAATALASSLAWDPTAEHFLIASGSTVISISDAGVSENLISSSSSSSSSVVNALAVDVARRRLLVSLNQPASVAAFDLRSRPHRQLFLSPLPLDCAPSALAVDSAGNAYVAAGSLVLTVDLEGKITRSLSLYQKSSVFSGREIFNGSLSGIAKVSSHGFLLLAERETGKLFKVDADDGAAKDVLTKGLPAAAMAEGMAMRKDGGLVVAGGGVTRWLKSDDGWTESAVYDETAVEESWRSVAVAVRDGHRVYALVMPTDGTDEKEKKRSRIEEVVWGKEEEGEMVWMLLLVGLCLAIFFFWRFQMRQLVNNMDKKIA